MNIKQILNEISDKPLPHKYYDVKSGLIGMFTSKGDKYMVWAMEKPGENVFELTFNTPRLRTFTAKSMGEEEKGNVFEVIATVKAILKKWLKKYKPNLITFGLLDKPKTRFRIFRRMLGEFGYELVPGKGLLFKRKEK